ncbi:hypothetical protein [Achromobacter ruhlandii]|uniref:hypothetical protein n=1 Tax=Achromobacter ruhlandii TaxID=72557 RepID=UPI001C12C9D2|nr:hypothetical protein [Achromobacter ruhlandii]
MKQMDVVLDPMAATQFERTRMQCQARGCDGCLVCKPEKYPLAADDLVVTRQLYSIYGIDPGPEESGWCVYLPEHHRVLSCGVKKNEDLLSYLQVVDHTRIAIEMIASYGMPVGKEVFETCVWIGRFIQAISEFRTAELVYRKDVKMHLCGTTQAKDSNVRQAILDRFPRTGGGATPQIGTKAKPGPLYGVSSHAWPAIGVALTVQAQQGAQA